MLGFIIFALLICYIVAWVMAMQLIAQAAREKGYGDITGKLWFIGFFGMIFTPAVIVSALPAKGAGPALAAAKAADDELPEI